MQKIVVFDSGLGSLSIIKPIQKRIKCEVIYFADQDSYPYGTKSVSKLEKIIKCTISKLQQKFNPDVIVVGSNTPSLLLDIENKNKIIGVFPPLKEAVSKTKTGKIGILATSSVVKSKSLDKYINQNISSKIQVTKINASSLVDLVESGKFLSKKQTSKKIIKKILTPYLENNIDVFTLSSTHLPFLLPLLTELFPGISFLNPADAVAQQVSKVLKHKKAKNSFKIYASGDIKKFHKKLIKIGIKNKVNTL